MRAYPQKQTVIVFFVCLLAVSGAAFYVFRVHAAQKASDIQALIVSQSSFATTSPLISTTADWRKQFLTASGTRSSFSAPVGSASAGGDTQPMTATDNLSQNFMMQYALLRQEGQTTDPQAVQDAMDQVVSQSTANLNGPRSYSSSDISEVADGSSVDAAYRSVVSSVFADYSARQDEADIAAQALENGDTSQLSAIDPIIKDYQGMIDKLLSVPVPRSIAVNHLNLLNALSSLLFSARAFRNIDADALKGFASIKLDALGTQLADDSFSAILGPTATTQ